MQNVATTVTALPVSPRERRVMRRLEARGASGLAKALLRLRGVVAGGRYRLAGLYAVGGEGAQGGVALAGLEDDLNAPA